MVLQYMYYSECSWTSLGNAVESREYNGLQINFLEAAQKRHYQSEFQIILGFECVDDKPRSNLSGRAFSIVIDS